MPTFLLDRLMAQLTSGAVAAERILVDKPCYPAVPLFHAAHAVLGETHISAGIRTFLVSGQPVTVDGTSEKCLEEEIAVADVEPVGERGEMKGPGFGFVKSRA